MRRVFTFVALILCSAGSVAPAMTIQIDYSFDSNNFFSASGNPDGATGAAQAKAALKAAAARWSAIIDQPLGVVILADDDRDPRIRVSHPGTGADWQISPATSQATDALVQQLGRAPANEYRGAWTIPENTWLLFTGAHNISPAAGFGGSETGTNFTSVINDPDGVNNRGFNLQSGPGAPSLPVWGGWMTFNNSTSIEWHFDHTTAPPVGKTDLYTIALHEIGHALGLHTGYWFDWEAQVSGGAFTGPSSVATYNSDNGTNVTSLTLDGLDHWTNDRYLSKIFPAGSPNYIGSVGAGVLGGLLMESRLPQGTRFEVTNVDVAALRDVGWSVVSGEVVEPEVAADLRIKRTSGGAIELSWTSSVGASYTVQGSFDLTAWINAATLSANVTSTVWQDTNVPAGGSKYYRVVSN